MTIPVLIVDDSAMSRKLIMRALPAELDCDVTEAANGKEALDAWRAGKGEVILLDLTMPVMDGYGTLETLRQEGAESFVVVVSADVQPRAEERVMELGARAFLKKPVNSAEIESVLRQNGIMTQ